MKNKKVIGVIVLLVLVALFIGFSSEQCDRCGEKFIGTAYYEAFNPDNTLCEKCAKEYYAPLPYKNYKK